MKILEITAFTSGFCGLWARVSKEAEFLAENGHKVQVFSSNIKRGSGKIETAPEYANLGKVKIQRFSTKGNFGENTYFWDFEKEALKFKPDIIITHAYRQYYSTKALSIANKLKIPCLLVTHAPFLDKKLRNWKLNLAVLVYDFFVGKRIVNKYSKILTITNWEVPYLLKLGVKKEKIIYSPNGIPEEFFKLNIPKQKKYKKRQILFLGRIAPIKDIKTLIKSMKIVLEKKKDVLLNLVGPEEEEYGKELHKLVQDLGLTKNILFHKPVYNLNKKIKIIDSNEVFILSSKREAMPQALIEAMSREKIVISSKTLGGMEIVQDKKNGYLFKIGDPSDLAEKIIYSLDDNKQNKEIKKQAKKSVEQFSWNKLIQETNDLIEKEIKNNSNS